MMNLGIRLLAMAALLPTVATVHGYPLDSADTTGIARLEGYRLAHEKKISGPRQPPLRKVSQAANQRPVLASVVA